MTEVRENCLVRNASKLYLFSEMFDASMLMSPATRCSASG